ncbi:MAG: tRNA lysidine(34) synthetase TilS [Clostridium sp.]|nr:tRNA lysidine(34) synthetase TilS [Clostridium sp.]
MIKDIKNNFLRYIEDNSLIKEGDGIVVGLSGGPDSVCLLHLLCSIRERMNIKIAAAHINHMIRGKEADKDEEYAKELCERLGVKFFSLRKDVEKYGKEKGLSSETAGRDVRYNFFNKVKGEMGYQKIATAHNANDQAETILMRIMRGTGLEGLGGIPVKREDKYIRPILFMKREEVEYYCESNKLNPRIDATNLEKLYSRNKVRLDILPYMKENFNKDVVEAINRMALLLQEDNDFILKQVDKYYSETCVVKKHRVVIKKEVFNLEKSIINRIIRKAIKEVNGDKYDVEMKHIQEVVALQKLDGNKRIDLPGDIYAENIYGDINIKVKSIANEEVQEEIKMNKNDVLGKEIKYKDYLFRFRLLENEKDINLNKNPNTRYFNYDLISDNIIIRNRKNGDKITPIGMRGSKKLKDLFIDMKIPKEERDLIPIVQFDEDIAWVFSVKLSDKFKVTRDINQILEVSVIREKNND